jgi:hypothetical protein
MYRRAAIQLHTGWFLTAALPIVVATFAMAGMRQPHGPPTSVTVNSFAGETARAMDRMMVAMAVEATGNVDRDFVSTMVPHHQGAIEMALAELRYGKDETLRRMAQEIVVEQKQEIDAMKLAAMRLPESRSIGPSPADVCSAPSATPAMHDMRMPQGQ